MNNAFLNEEVSEDTSSILSREKVETLTETIEALQHVLGSSYWKVLQKNVFDVDLDRAKRRIVNEKDTTEIFRLQGEIRWGDKFSLETLLQKYKEELAALRKKTYE